MLFLARVHDFEPVIKATNIKAANSSEVRVGVDIAMRERKKMEVKQLHEEKSKKEKRKKKLFNNRAVNDDDRRESEEKKNKREWQKKRVVFCMN